MLKEKEGIEIEGHRGKWYVIDTKESKETGTIYLLEHEEYGDDAACIIVDGNKNVLIEDVWNGFLDYEETLLGKANIVER